MAKRSAEEITVLRKAFSDITKGYTICEYDGETLYVKHLTHHDHVDLDMMYDFYYQQALDNGMRSASDMSDMLIEQKLWSKDKDHEISSLRKSLEIMEQTKKHIHLVSKLEEHNKEAEKIQKELGAILSEKSELMGKTAEAHAEVKLEEYYIFNSFYYDKRFEDKVFTEKKTEYMSDSELKKIVYIFSKAVSHVTDQKIKQIALNDFFQMYFCLTTEEMYGFFGTTGLANLTFNQVKLLNYGRIFRGIFQRLEKIPDNVKDDPDKLIDYANTIEKTKETMNKSAKSGNRFSSVVGATNEDINNIGADDANTINLSKKLEEAKKQGKTRLGMEEMMKIFGN